MYLGVINVNPLEKYQLELTFENNEKRIFNLKPYLDTGIFSELVDEKLFKSVFVNYDTIEWKNGADLDPEILYEKSIPLVPTIL